MEMISKYFSWAEVINSLTASELGINNLPSKLQTRNVLLAAQELDKVRMLLGCPIIVTSWFRSEALNKFVKGAKNSAHLEGWAIDFKTNRFSNFEVCELIENSELQFDQLILEPSWVHISFAPEMRMELLTLKKAGSPYLKGIIK